MKIEWMALIMLTAFPAFAQGPRIAVVLDDFGLTYPKNPPDSDWMKLDQPLTFAVMPESPRTKIAARETVAAGKELIIHFPFDPFQSFDLAKDSATPADVEKASRLLEKSLKQISGAVGLNNHRSYKATQNPPLMKAFMAILKKKGIYFVDSKVTPKTVAGAEAREAGIKTMTNFIFLDTAQIHTKPFCQKMLAQAVAHARKKGDTLIIGHHYFHGTYDCLAEEMPRYAKEGVQFVKASEIVR